MQNMAYMMDYAREEVAKAKAEGTLITLYELVESGDLPIEKAAKKAGLSEKQFVNNMTVTGHKLP